MALGAAAPLCSWLIAAYVSSTVGGLARDDAPASAGPIGRRSRRRSARLKQFSGENWSPLNGAGSGGSTDLLSYGSIVAFCGSSLNGIGSCLTFEGCPEYHKQPQIFGDGMAGLFGDSMFFGDGMGGLRSKSLRAARRHAKARAGKPMAIAVQPMRETSGRKKLSTKDRRVVVTGMGVVSPLGHNPDSFYDNLLDGQSGISEIQGFDCRDFPTRIAGEVRNFSTDGWVAPKFAKRMDKFMLYLLTAGKMAVVDAGITEDVMMELDKAKCGILIGSAMGGMQVFNDAVTALRTSYRKMNPFCVPFATTNMGSAMLAMDLKVNPMQTNFVTPSEAALSQSDDNICNTSVLASPRAGWGQITPSQQLVQQDIMLSGGSDAAIIPIGLGGFVACRALSQRNDDPVKASRPWDSERDGFVMGEGAGVILLEELEHAKARGAEIYAEFLGGSFTCDAYHMTEPHPEGTGVRLCIEKALAQSGVRPQDVNYVNAHATSTRAGDLQEYKALMQVFGHNPELKVNSTKSMIGHLLGAAGAVEAIATIQDMGVIVGDKKQRLDIKVALSNSFGFGGQNSSVLFSPYDPSKKSSLLILLQAFVSSTLQEGESCTQIVL